MELLLEKAKKEKIDDIIFSQYNQLAYRIKQSEEAEIENYKAEIIKQIEEELIIRNEYRDGLYSFYTQQNIEIKKAKDVLNNITEYKSILKQ